MKYAKPALGLRAGCLDEVVTALAEVADLRTGHGLSLADDVGEAECRSTYAEPLGRQLAINDGGRAASAFVSRTAG